MEQFEKEGRLVYSKVEMPCYKRYLDEMPGIPIQDIWTDIPPINSQAKERLGYPTQKPEALLERIIRASSNEGDLVLDPFCGCGTALNVAERLKRHWIGIDITHLAITLIKERLKDTFEEDLAPYEVVGEPADLLSAEALALANRHQFEWWALGRVAARPAQDKKKGADSGIDGVIHFTDDNSGIFKKVIIQVKSGHVNAVDNPGPERGAGAGTGGHRGAPDPEAAHQTHAGRGRWPRASMSRSFSPATASRACKSSPSPNSSPARNCNTPASPPPAPSKKPPASVNPARSKSRCCKLVGRASPPALCLSFPSSSLGTPLCPKLQLWQDFDSLQLYAVNPLPGLGWGGVIGASEPATTTLPLPPSAPGRGNLMAVGRESPAPPAYGTMAFAKSFFTTPEPRI